MSTKNLTLAHSPDSDDAFMFIPIIKGLIDCKGYSFEESLHDIQSLNEFAREGEYDITALSLHGYFYVSDRYDILNCGASVGDNYGPIIIASSPDKQLTAESTVAIPGDLTTAALVLKMYMPGLNTVQEQFDRIPDKVTNREYDFGLIIHEGQVTYKRLGLHKVADLGEWYFNKYKLPLVLGVVAIKKEIENKEEIETVLRTSVEYSLNHAEEIIPHTKKYARGLTDSELKKFLNMYVNSYTIEMDEKLKESIEILGSFVQAVQK